MSGRSFIDTNIFVYAVDSRDSAKQAKARNCLAQLGQSRQGVVSSQVCLEFAANVVRKLGQSPVSAAAGMAVFEAFEQVPLTNEIVVQALMLQAQFSLSIWDAAILAAAQDAKCTTLFTEDLQHGLRVGRLTIVNPFL